MSLYTVIAVLFTVAVALTYLNCRFIKLPTTIAIMAGSLGISLCLIVLSRLGFNEVGAFAANRLAAIDFHHFLMDGLLSFLLFAGALTVNINDLAQRKWEIGVLAFLGTLASTFLVGILSYYVLNAMAFHISFLNCLLFGALISPTDPIAVLAMLKELNAPRSLEVTVAGESLFNDGVGIVIFITLYELAFSGHHPSITSVSLLFLREAVGGILYGAALGLLAFWLMRPLKNHKVEILMTLAVATGGYALAQAIDISGPLAMVVAGIFIGNKGRKFNMSHTSRDNLDNFWELVDEILNALLFLIIGFEILVLPVNRWYFVAGLLAIPMVLLVRYVIVALPMSLFKLRKKYAPHTINIMVWGGLRGGLAVALALALPASNDRNLIITMTYAVVVFAILVQGLTIKPLVKKTHPQN